MSLSPYIDLTREEWSWLRNSTPLTLAEDDLAKLRGINERVSLREVEDIYLPLSRLLNLYVDATQKLHKATHTFLGNSTEKVPYVLGVAGSVAWGKRPRRASCRRCWRDGPTTRRSTWSRPTGFCFRTPSWKRAI